MSVERQMRRLRTHYLQAVLKQEVAWFDEVGTWSSRKGDGERSTVSLSVRQPVSLAAGQKQTQFYCCRGGIAYRL